MIFLLDAETGAVSESCLPIACVAAVLRIGGQCLHWFFGSCAGFDSPARCILDSLSLWFNWALLGVAQTYGSHYPDWISIVCLSGLIGSPTVWSLKNTEVLYPRKFYFLHWSNNFNSLVKMDHRALGPLSWICSSWSRACYLPKLHHSLSMLSLAWRVCRCFSLPGLSYWSYTSIE